MTEREVSDKIIKYESALNQLVRFGDVQSPSGEYGCVLPVLPAAQLPFAKEFGM